MKNGIGKDEKVKQKVLDMKNLNESETLMEILDI